MSRFSKRLLIHTLSHCTFYLFALHTCNSFCDIAEHMKTMRVEGVSNPKGTSGSLTKQFRKMATKTGMSGRCLWRFINHQELNMSNNDVSCITKPPQKKV